MMVGAEKPGRAEGWGGEQRLLCEKPNDPEKPNNPPGKPAGLKAGRGEQGLL
jgi:hypothetical protein